MKPQRWCCWGEPSGPATYSALRGLNYKAGRRGLWVMSISFRAVSTARKGPSGKPHRMAWGTLLVCPNQATVPWAQVLCVGYNIQQICILLQ